MTPYGNGAPSGPNYLLFSDADRLADALWDRSEVGWSPTPHARELGALQRALDRKLWGIMVQSNRAQRTLLICMYRWERPRMRRRRLPTSSTDPRRAQGDLRATNRQVPLARPPRVHPPKKKKSTPSMQRSRRWRAGIVGVKRRLFRSQYAIAQAQVRATAPSMKTPPRPVMRAVQKSTAPAPPLNSEKEQEPRGRRPRPAATTPPRDE